MRDDVVSRFKVGRLLQFYRAPSLDYKVRIWADLYRNFYQAIPDTPVKRKWLARRLREAAKWVEAGK